MSQSWECHKNKGFNNDKFKSLKETNLSGRAFCANENQSSKKNNFLKSGAEFMADLEHRLRVLRHFKVAELFSKPDILLATR